MAASYVQLVEPKDGGNELFQEKFVATLPNKQRCFLKTNKDIWLGYQCDVVMSRLRGSIIQKAGKTGENLSDDICMTHEIPWQNAWLSFKNQVLQLQMRSTKHSSKDSSGHKSRANATQSQPWSLGTNFKDCSSKSKAKLRVLAELETVLGK